MHIWYIHDYFILPVQHTFLVFVLGVYCRVLLQKTADESWMMMLPLYWDIIIFQLHFEPVLIYLKGGIMIIDNYKKFFDTHTFKRQFLFELTFASILVGSVKTKKQRNGWWHPSSWSYLPLYGNACKRLVLNFINCLWKSACVSVYFFCYRFARNIPGLISIVLWQKMPWDLSFFPIIIYIIWCR